MPNHINHEAWSRIRDICNNLDDHRVINKHIEEAIKLKMKRTKQVVSRDKLVYLRNNRIGTTRIENLAKQIEHGHIRNSNTVVFIVENNLKRVEKCIKELKHEILSKDKIISTLLKTEWRRQLFKELCHSVIDPLWNKEKEYSRKSRMYLFAKYKNNSQQQGHSQGR